MGGDLRGPDEAPRDNAPAQAIPDEESPLLSESDSAERKTKTATAVGTIVAVLLLGRQPSINVGNPY